jgi:hypothetical protein
MCGVSILELDSLPEFRVAEAMVLLKAKRGARRNQFKESGVMPVIDLENVF